MPELVAGGPYIPVPLLNAVDDGSVVFFCGAGVSTAPGSDLPGFSDLVDHVYTDNRIEPDLIEKAALDRHEFDKALGLLERPERLGTQQVRRSVIDRLSAPPTGQLVTHRALITLSRVATGIRLVTTNFDNRFGEAGLHENDVDVAPRLPLPKPHNWSSLVHLHGRIPQDESRDTSSIVLTAADFGRSYLTERWASRFVTDLFREFTVVFVGYSLGDRVMSYLIDALSAERAMGARFATAYAFASYCHPCSRADAEVEWRAKNVEPILYDARDNHKLLTETLVAWAQIKADPFRTRRQIVLEEITKLPDGPGLERITWALQDPTAAKALAEAAPMGSDVDFSRIAQWLERFYDAGLLSRAAQDRDHSPSVRLVDHTHVPGQVDSVTRELARWMARHLHVPQVLAWVLKKGGSLHPMVRDLIRSALTSQSLSVEIPPKLRHLWTILSAEPPVDPNRFLFASNHLALASDAERRRIEDQAIASIAPRLVVRAGASNSDIAQEIYGNRPGPTLPMDSCGHVELIAGDADERHHIQQLLQDRDLLIRHAETLTSYLEHALRLLDETDATPSWQYRPSIADHPQNDHRAESAHLVDLVRDSYTALTAKDRSRARQFLRRWTISKHPLFRRIALHALTHDPEGAVGYARRLLLSGRNPGLWDLEMRHEVLGFLRLAGSRLPRTLLTTLVHAIHAGPESDEDYSASLAERAIRIRSLVCSGAEIDQKSKSFVDQWSESASVANDDRAEFLTWRDEGRWVGWEDYAPRNLINASVSDIMEALRGNQIEPRGLMGLAIRRPQDAITALRKLAEVSEWPAKYWQNLLAAVADLRHKKNLNIEIQNQIVELLLGAPVDFVESINTDMARFIEDLASDYDCDAESRFGELWHKTWSGVRDAEQTGQHVVDQALRHAAGKLAQAAIERLWKHGPKTDCGLPDAVRSYFDKIATDPNGGLGRVILASLLYSLFTIDPSWTTDNIISRLRPAESVEAYDLWSGYAMSARIGPNLQAAFEVPFLEMLRMYERVHDRNNVLIAMLVMICIDSPSPIDPCRVRQVVTSLSEEALIGVALYLTSRVVGDSSERAQIWHRTIRPWLDAYWPRDGMRNTAGTSHALLKLVLECGDAFPGAVTWSANRETLSSITDLLPLHRLTRGGRDHINRYPDDVLRLLIEVTQSMSDNDRPFLQEILESLRIANPGLVDNVEFQDLLRRATR